MHGMHFFIYRYFEHLLWFFQKVEEFLYVFGHLGCKRHLSAIHVIGFPIFPLNQYFLDSKALYKYEASFSLMSEK